MTGRDEAVASLTAPGQPFELRVEDVRGQQLQVFARRQRTLGHLLMGSARHEDAEYLVTEGSRMSFAEHLDAVTALAVALRTEHGVGRGDRVAICAANCPEWVVAFWAAQALGAVVVGMNSLWARPEIVHAIEQTEPTVIVADAARRLLIGEPGVPVLSVEQDLPASRERHAGAPLPEDPLTLVDEDDPAVVLFTSGTSGRPKGATHSHRNVIGAVWFHLLNDAVAAELGSPPPPRRWLLATPLFHIAALHNIAVIRLVVGDTAVLHVGGFDIERVLRLIETERVTNWGAVPTMASRLVEHAERHGLEAYDLSSLRTFTVNSAPSAPLLKQRIREVLPVAGATLGTTYGLTESSSAATLAGAADLAADPDTVGRPVPTMEVEVRDDDGRPVPEGVEGEVCLRGPMVMIGYWRDPRGTAAVTTPDGFLRTGDLGSMHDGRLRISSRRSDLILRGAENVYPAEVENALDAHPDVLESIVMGVPHPDLGEEVAAVVVLRTDATAGVAQLQEHVQGLLARYKVPTRWTLTSQALPRNATGKVLRRAVRVG